jgi:hypothetical protein
VVIRDLYVLGSDVSPSKNDPPLIVDANRVFVGEIALQGLKAIAGRSGKVTETARIVQLNKLPASNLGEAGRKALWNATMIQDHLGQVAFEAPNHLVVSKFCNIKRITV